MRNTRQTSAALRVVVICLFVCGVLSDYGDKLALRTQILFDVANYLRQEDREAQQQTRQQICDQNFAGLNELADVRSQTNRRTLDCGDNLTASTVCVRAFNLLQ
jgi:hypothetical protein